MRSLRSERAKKDRLSVEVDKIFPAIPLPPRPSLALLLDYLFVISLSIVLKLKSLRSLPSSDE